MEKVAFPQINHPNRLISVFNVLQDVGIQELTYGPTISQFHGAKQFTYDIFKLDLLYQTHRIHTCACSSQTSMGAR